MNRTSWLLAQIKANRYTIGAEVGCKEGRNASKLLQFCPSLKLICVDLWEYVPWVYAQHLQLEDYSSWDFKKIYQQFCHNTARYKDRVIKLIGISWEMAKEVADNSLDFVFIDADHGYESVVKDINAWTPKLKPGGLLSGHDISWPGVRKAVDELTKSWVDTQVNQVWYCKKEDYGI